GVVHRVLVRREPALLAGAAVRLPRDGPALAGVVGDPDTDAGLAVLPRPRFPGEHLEPPGFEGERHPRLTPDVVLEVAEHRLGVGVLLAGDLHTGSGEPRDGGGATRDSVGDEALPQLVSGLRVD